MFLLLFAVLALSLWSCACLRGASFAAICHARTCFVYLGLHSFSVARHAFGEHILPLCAVPALSLSRMSRLEWLRIIQNGPEWLDWPRLVQNVPALARMVRMTQNDPE